jgi:TusA-related sulfurtransferase
VKPEVESLVKPDIASAVAIYGGDLPLGGGLLALLRSALDPLEPGGTLALLSSAATVAEDLPSWCRSAGNVYLGAERMPGGPVRHLIARGPFDRWLAPEAPQERASAGRSTDVVPMPARADPASGFAPRGVHLEPGRPGYPFELCERDRVAPPQIAALYEQAVAAQWSPAVDIPWQTVAPLAPALDRALSQVFHFLAENELAALFVPSRFVSRIHPAFVETAQFLATQINDEARHIDVFLKRARLSDGQAVSSTTTARSLLTLLEIEDFTEVSFLLSVLGEGTFLDLLRFAQEHAPDEATAELTRRAAADETRHVHFGISHVRHALGLDPALYTRLSAAVQRRSEALRDAGGVPPSLQDALTILAAGGVAPPAIRRGHDAVRELFARMGEERIRRLESAGFARGQAEELSGLHTPNFM